jgi:hypothetical protein
VPRDGELRLGCDGFGAVVADETHNRVLADTGGRGRAVGVAISEVPFAEMRGAIAGLLEKPRAGGGAALTGASSNAVSSARVSFMAGWQTGLSS